MAQYQSLQVPPPGAEKGGVEIVRAALLDGQLYVTLRPMFDDPRGWGQVLADLAHHAAQAYAQNTGSPHADALAAIRTQFAEALDADAQGRVHSVSQLP